MRDIPRDLSVRSSTAAAATGSQNEGQPEPLSNLAAVLPGQRVSAPVRPWNSGCSRAARARDTHVKSGSPQHTQRKVPFPFTSFSLELHGRSVPPCAEGAVVSRGPRLWARRDPPPAASRWTSTHVSRHVVLRGRQPRLPVHVGQVSAVGGHGAARRLASHSADAHRCQGDYHGPSAPDEEWALRLERSKAGAQHVE